MGYVALTQERINKFRQSMNGANIAGGVAVGNSAKSFEIQTGSGAVKMSIGDDGKIQSVTPSTSFFNSSGGSSGSSSGSSSSKSNDTSTAEIKCNNIPIVTSVYYDTETHTLYFKEGKLSFENNTFSVKSITAKTVFVATPHSGEI